MSTILRRRRGSRLHLTAYKRLELLTGRIEPLVPAYDGYATTGNRKNLADYIDASMRADWAANREMLMEVWMSGQSDAHAFPDDCLPWLCSYVPRGSLPWARQHLD